MARKHEWWRVGDHLEGDEEALCEAELKKLPEPNPSEVATLRAVLLWRKDKTMVLAEPQDLAGHAHEWVVIAVGRELVVHHLAGITGGSRSDADRWLDGRAPETNRLTPHAVVEFAKP